MYPVRRARSRALDARLFRDLTLQLQHSGAEEHIAAQFAYNPHRMEQESIRLPVCAGTRAC
jgi:hypothetical protein